MPKKGKKVKKRKRPLKRLSIKKERVGTKLPKVIIREREFARRISREIKREVPGKEESA